MEGRLGPTLTVHREDSQLVPLGLYDNDVVATIVVHVADFGVVAATVPEGEGARGFRLDRPLAVA